MVTDLGYCVERGAQAVAFFAMKAGGAIDVMKVAQLVYLAERDCMNIVDEPMFFDTIVSSPHGPLPSVTLRFINGEMADERWSAFVGVRSGDDVSLARPDIAVADLDYLSVSDIEILTVAWERFGALTAPEIDAWFRNPENLPEWGGPEEGSNPITYSDIFHALGRTDAVELGKSAEETKRVAVFLQEFL